MLSISTALALCHTEAEWRAAKLTDLQLCHITKNEKRCVRVCVCVWAGWDQLRCSQTAVPPPHPHFLTMLRKASVHVCSSVWKKCVLDVCFAGSWLAESVLLRKPNQSLLLRKQDFPPPCRGCFDGYSASGVVFAAVPLSIPVCWRVSQLLRVKLEQSCCYTLQSAALCVT